MDNDDRILEEIAELRAEVASLRKRRSTVKIVAAAVVLLSVSGIGTASALAGHNTVFSDDITDGNVKTPDLAAGAVTGAKIKDGAITGADVNESTLAPYLASRKGLPANGNCYADGIGDCITMTLTTKKGSIFIDGTGTFSSTVGAECAFVALVVDGVLAESRVQCSNFMDSTSLDGLVPVTAGRHTVSLRFTHAAGYQDQNPALYGPRLIAFQVG